MNLLQDLTPETAAMMLKSVFLMDSHQERFWTDTGALQLANAVQLFV